MSILYILYNSPAIILFVIVLVVLLRLLKLLSILSSIMSKLISDSPDSNKDDNPIASSHIPTFSHCMDVFGHIPISHISNPIREFKNKLDDFHSDNPKAGKWNRVPAREPYTTEEAALEAEAEAETQAEYERLSRPEHG